MYCEEEQTNMIALFNELDFIYLGMTQQRTDKGYPMEEQNTLFGRIMVKSNKHNMSAWNDKENTTDVIRKPKHRYVFFNADDERKKELYYKLNYTEKVKPIP